MDGKNVDYVTRVHEFNPPDVPVEFVLSDHDFYNYGWEMHPLHVRALNTTFEQSAKLFMRTCITIDTLMSGSLAASIRRFQDRYNYPEDVWSFQSIKKDIDRNTNRIEIDFDTDIYEKIQKILNDYPYSCTYGNTSYPVGKVWSQTLRAGSCL